MNLRRRLQTAAALPREERWLALRATAALIVAPFLVRLLGITRLQRAFGTTPAGRRTGLHDAPAVRRAVDRAARTIPWATCLPRALVAARLLRQEGLPAEIVIGVAPRAPGQGGAAVEAHAWVRSGGLVVTGDLELERYAELARFGAQS